MTKFIKYTLIFILLMCIAGTKSANAQYYLMEGDLVGNPAPDFTLDSLAQKNLNFTKYRDGHNAIIFFWATWCPHCRVQLEELNNNREKFEKEQIKLVVVDLGESKKQVEKYVKKNSIDLDMFLDKQGDLEREYQLMGVPTFYFVNNEGQVTAVRHSLPKDYQAFFNTQ